MKLTGLIIATSLWIAASAGAATVETYQYGYYLDENDGETNGVVTISTNMTLNADVNLLVVAVYDDLGASYTNAQYGGVDADGILHEARFGYCYWLNPSTASNQTLTVSSSSDTVRFATQVIGVSGIDTAVPVNYATSANNITTLITSNANMFVVAGIGGNGDNGPCDPVSPLQGSADGFTFETQGHSGGGYCSIGVRSIAEAGTNDIEFASVGYSRGHVAMAFGNQEVVPPLLPGTSSPVGDIGTNAPVLVSTFLDGSETADASSVEMYLNDIAVTNFMTAYSNQTFTVTAQPTLDYNAAYTAAVVVASDPGGTLFTNEWTFSIGPDYTAITYVDITVTNTWMALSADGPIGAGTELITNADAVSNNTWRSRSGDFGIPPSQTTVPVGDGAVTSGDLLESSSWNYDDNCPRLRTEVAVANGGYNAYVFFWNDRADWSIRASLTDDASPLPLYGPSSSNSTVVATDTAGRELHMANLGPVIVSDGILKIYTEDVPHTPGATDSQRSWLDGIGFESLGGPTLDPVIEAFSIAGNTATLTWTSEAIGTYSIMHKTDVQNDATWTPVKTGILGGVSNTTDSVTISGAATEFFRIEGN